MRSLLPKLLFALVAVVPHTAFADRFNQGGSWGADPLGALLLIGFLAFLFFTMKSKQRWAFIGVWAGGALLLYGIFGWVWGLLWVFVGMWPAFLIASMDVFRGKSETPDDLGK